MAKPKEKSKNKSKKPLGPEELSPLREAFCRNRLTMGHSESYRVAREAYGNKNASGKHDHVYAFRLEQKPEIKARIAELRAAVDDDTVISTKEIMAELAKIARANAGDFFEWGPGGITVIPKEKLSRDQQSVVSEVSETVTKDGGTIRIKLHDKLGALNALARIMGMNKDNVNLEVTGLKGLINIDIDKV